MYTLLTNSRAFDFCDCLNFKFSATEFCCELRCFAVLIDICRNHRAVERETGCIQGTSLNRRKSRKILFLSGWSWCSLADDVTSRDDVRGGRGIVGDIRCHVTRHTFVSNTPNVYWSVPEWHAGCAGWVRRRARGSRNGKRHQFVVFSETSSSERLPAAVLVCLPAPPCVRLCYSIWRYSTSGCTPDTVAGRGIKRGRASIEKSVRHKDASTDATIDIDCMMIETL